MTSHTGYIESEDELIDLLLVYIRGKIQAARVTSETSAVPEPQEADEDDEEVEMPDDLVSLGYEEQQALIKKRAFGMMGLGTALIIVFSDPMVDVM